MSNALKGLPGQYLDSIPWRVFKRLAFYQILLTSFLAISTAYLARYYLKESVVKQSIAQAKSELSLLRNFIRGQNLSPAEWCRGSDFEHLKYDHLTLFDDRGQTLCSWPDDHTHQTNPIAWPEIKRAFEDGEGVVVRKFEDHEGDSVNSAIHLESEGRVYLLHLNFSLNSMLISMESLDKAILFFLFPLLVLISLLSLYNSIQVSTPLGQILEKMQEIRNMSRAEKESAQELTIPDQQDEWAVLEKTVDQIKLDLGSYLNDLYVENEKISKLMASISDCILAIDNKQNILFANVQFRKNFVPKIWRKQKLDEFKVWEIIREHDILELGNLVIDTGERRKERQLQLDIKEGKAKAYFDLTVSPLEQADGSIIGAVYVFHNVTDKRTAEQLREDFVTNVSHEVRTPLTALKGYVQMLRQSLYDPQKKEIVEECMNKIVSNSDRLTHLFSDILNLNVIETKKKIKKEWVLVEDLTSQVISNVKQSYPEKNITITLDYKIDRIHVQPQLFEQVVNNLLDNAYKYTPEGSNVIIEWDQNDKNYILNLRDNGELIPTEHFSRLFERFYRMDNHRSREMGGTGLGLAIVKHIVQKHLGKISVNHNPNGIGNVFTVKVPRKKSKHKNEFNQLTS